jgi:hypothetical protein
MAAQRLTILSLKKFRNDEASADGEIEQGRDLGKFRPSRASSAFHNFLGLPRLDEILFR